jgi:hypothetical protein
MSYIISASLCRTLVISLIGLAILLTSIVPRAALAQMMALPRSMDELLEEVTLVVVGEIGQPVRCTDILGTPFDCDNPEWTIDMQGPWVTTFQLFVEEVLLDDGVVASGVPINVWIFGPPIELDPQQIEGIEYPPSVPGDRHLFLLTGSNGSYAPAFGPYGRLNIDGESLYISSGTPRPFRFAYGDDPITLEELKQILADRQPESQEVAPLYFPLLRGASAIQGTDSTDAQSFFDTVVRTAVAIWQQYTNYLQESRANQS